MLVKNVVTAVRSKVNDKDTVHWTDVQLMFWITAANRMLFRRRAQAEDLYGQVTHVMLKTETDRVRQVKKNVFRYYLPTWWYKIYQVRDMEIEGAGVTTSGNHGSEIKRRTWPRDPNKGWHFSGDRTIDLVGYDAGIDIEIDIAKVPPMLHYATVDSNCMTSSELRMASAPVDDASPANPFSVSREKDAFVGMEFEIVLGSSATTDRRGVVAECISQDKFYDNTLGKWITRLEVFPEFETPPRSGDKYEMHLPVDDTNMEYISALVARSLFAENRNIQGMRGLEMLLKEGEDTFISGLRPRQEQERDALVHPDFLGQDYEALDKDWTGDV